MSVAHKSDHIILVIPRPELFGKIFEGEMLIRTKLTTIQIFQFISFFSKVFEFRTTVLKGA